MPGIRHLAEEHDTVPFGIFLALTLAIVPLARRRESQVADRGAAGREPRFRVGRSQRGLLVRTDPLVVRGRARRQSLRDPAASDLGLDRR